MAYNPYGSSPHGNSPYGQQQQPPPQQQQYGQNTQYQQSPYQDSSRPSGNAYGNPPPPPPPPQNYAPQSNYNDNNQYGSTKQEYEMGKVPPAAYQQQPPLQVSRAIMDQTTTINQRLREMDGPDGQLEAIKRAQKTYSSSDNTGVLREIEQQSNDLMSQYRAMAAELKRIKAMPGAQSDPKNKGHVDFCQNNIQTALNKLRAQDEAFRRTIVDAQARQYMIVNPGMRYEDAVRKAEDDNNVGASVFQQQLANMTRYGQATAVRDNVTARHEAIKSIERTMIELAQISNDLAIAVMEQQPMIEKIQENAVQTEANVGAGVVDIKEATKKAKAARRKKWICFWICILILVIVAAVVLGYGATQGWYKTNKSTS